MLKKITLLTISILIAGCNGSTSSNSAGSANSASAGKSPGSTSSSSSSSAQNGATGGFSGGDGSSANPFIIRTPTDLQDMDSNLSAHYELAENIDMSGINFMPIGNSVATPFTGNFQGNGYTISNLKVPASENQAYAGLFGVCSGSCMILNFVLSNVNISGTNYTGGAVGLLSAGLQHVSVTGVISGTGINNDGAFGFDTGSGNCISFNGTVNGSPFSSTYFGCH